MVIRQQTGPWCMPHSLRAIQSDRITVVIAPILLLPFVKNCVSVMLATFGSAPVKRSRTASSRVGARERSGQDPRRTRTNRNPAAQETSTMGGPHNPKHNTTEPQMQKGGSGEQDERPNGQTAPPDRHPKARTGGQVSPRPTKGRFSLWVLYLWLGLLVKARMKASVWMWPVA